MLRLIATIMTAILMMGVAAYASNDHEHKTARIYYKSGTNHHPAGSGFFIANGYVVTNEHVVSNFFDDSASIYVTGGQKREYITASLVASDKTRDLALLATNQNGHPYFVIADKAEKGADIVVLGYGDGPELTRREAKITHLSMQMQGIDSSTGKIKAALERMVYNIPGYPGLSGSPIINIDGEVVGVHLGSLRKEGMSVAVSLDDLKQFLSANVP